MEYPLIVSYDDLDCIFFLRELTANLMRESPQNRLGCQTDGWTSLKKDYDYHAVRSVQRFLFGKLAQSYWTFSTWFNLLPPGGEVHDHDHALSTFAAVLHLSDGSPLSFPSLSMTITTYPGQIVVFPGSLVHRVARQEGKEDRLSMSMNIERREKH